MQHPLLQINGLHASIAEKEILRGVSLEVAEGELHAIMGPNGSGKSTLVNVLMGHPSYEVTEGEVLFDGKNLLDMAPEERACTGLFLAFQYPKEIAGVTLRSFLHAAYNAQMSARQTDFRKLSPMKFKKLLEEKMEELKMETAFAERPINKGFSGGEKKKAEILQMKLLEPSLALLDETDSGLDIDALKIVAEGISDMRSPKFTGLLVTHYARILQYVTPDKVHVMVNGKIVESGGAELAEKLEKEGYEQFESQKTLPLHTS